MALAPLGAGAIRRYPLGASSAGPQHFRFDEFIKLGLRARNDPRVVVADPQARYFGAEMDEVSLVPNDDARLGEIHFEDWLEHSAPKPILVER